MIYVLCTDIDRPSGGRKVLYDIVDILNDCGLNAVALHQKRKFRYTWFNNSIPVDYTWQFKKNRKDKKFWVFKLIFLLKFNRLKFCDSDILVLPFMRISNYELFKDFKGKKVFLSQGPFLVLNEIWPRLRLISEEMKNYKYVSCSEMGHEILCKMYDNIDWNYLTIPIDLNLFQCDSKDILKIPNISYMSRRNSREIDFIIFQLQKSRKINFIEISNMNYEDVAITMKKSQIFLSFSKLEGLGMPPIEATMAGNYVIGYSGIGGNEYFDRVETPSIIKIEENNILQFIHKINEVLELYHSDYDNYISNINISKNFIVQKYSNDKNKIQWSNFFQKLINESKENI